MNNQLEQQRVLPKALPASPRLRNASAPRPAVIVVSPTPTPSLRRLATPCRRLTAKRARAAVLCGLLVFAGVQFGSVVALDHWRSDLRDPEYGHKLTRLRTRLAEEPDRPLMLALGSSRTEMGFRPEVLADSFGQSSSAPLVFNFALSGSGPLQELLCLRRLLAEGIRPSWLLVEVLPPALPETREEDRIAVNRLAWNDLPLLQRYSTQPERFSSQWLQNTPAPWYTHRFSLMSHYAPAWLPWQCRQDHVWQGLDASGWLTYPRESVSAERRSQEVERANREYASRLQQFTVEHVPDRALREMLSLCREEGIKVMLFLMPEGSEFRGWYSARAQAVLDGYLEQLRQEHGVAVADARTWAADAEFIDSHHLLPQGASAFTLRFGREGLQPFLLAKSPSRQGN